MTVIVASTTLPFSALIGVTGIAGDLIFKIVDPVADTIVYGPTGTGIEEDDPGLYDIDSVPVPSSEGNYRAVWIRLSTGLVESYADFMVVSGDVPAAAGPGGGVPAYTTADPYLIKRYDTEPDFIVQLLKRDGTAYLIPDDSEVRLTIQPNSAQQANFPGVPLFHSLVTSWTSGGLVTQSWQAGDVSWVGRCLAEVEVITPEPETLSFPGAYETEKYFAMEVIADEDPGIL